MYKNIVVGTDGSTTAARAVDAAADLARSFGSKLHLVSAYAMTTSSMASASGVAVIDPDGSHALHRAATDVLADACTRLDGVETAAHPVCGAPSDVLVRVADELGADLIVVGSKGMRGARRLLGSVPNSVAHAAPCAVLVVKTD